jgi:outer membrane protein TolC
MKKKVFNYLLMGVFVNTYAQNGIENYIKIGLENNEVVKQYNFDISKSVWAIQEAKSLFYPTVTLNGNYTIADGGRTVDFPAGNLLNPVYSSLNQLTNSSSFPTVQNQSILLNPNNFYDVKIHTVMPLLNYEIIYNKKIKSQQNEIQKIELEIYKRELVKEIKVGYYKYLQSLQAIKIYEEALKLTLENQRVNQSLFKNDKINRTAVLRSDNEVKKIEANLTEAKATSKNAQSYFNFLLNQPLNIEIETDNTKLDIPLTLQTDNTATREELSKLQTASAINNSLEKLTQSNWFPKLNAFVDFGYQDFDFVIDQQSRYYFGGVAFEWSIFSGNKNKFKIKQIEEEKKKLNSQTDNIKQQLQLQYEIAKNNLLAKIEIYKAEKDQNTAATKYNDDVSKSYKQGQAIYIELLDAQNQYINSLLNTNIALYNAWIAQAELERANASYNFKL